MLSGKFPTLLYQRGVQPFGEHIVGVNAGKIKMVTSGRSDTQDGPDERLANA
jgi:hypothetical protein